MLRSLMGLISRRFGSGTSIAALVRSLFANSEPGVIYDPSDLTTLFQDVAGTTPVTTPGQTVALMLDKSGNEDHATQATAASRPAYGIVPVGGRRNLLTYTEDFGNAAWVKVRATVAASGENWKFIPTAVSGTHRVDQVVAPTAGVTYTVAYRVKADGYDGFALQIGATAIATDYARFDLTNGTAFSFGTAAASIEADTDGFYWCYCTMAAGASDRLVAAVWDGSTQSFTGDGTSGVIVSQAQFEQSSTATNYQKVTTALDVTEAGVRSLGYLLFDGVDDFMLTPTIAPGIDKVQVFAGVRKLSDAAQGIIVESSVDLTINNGTFYILAPGSAGTANYRNASKGTIQEVGATSADFAAPRTDAITSISDISGDSNILRVNGAEVKNAAADQGTGNYLAYPLYIGARAGTSLRFNGHLYSTIVRFGGNLDATQIANAERYTANKTGITL